MGRQDGDDSTPQPYGMNIKLHKNATTTPAIRKQIREAQGSEASIARRFGVTPSTVRRWRGRATGEDRSHTPHRLQTTLNAAQEAVVLELRRSLGLSLDDLTGVVREFLHPTILRSSVHRLLKRNGLSARPVTGGPDKPAHKPFKVYEPGYLHVDVKYLPQMPGESSRRYLFVAIDRATRWVFVRIMDTKSARCAATFLRALAKACPVRIEKILTDNGKEFTDRFVTTGERTPTGLHEFDALCESLGIEHRLIRPKRPQTNGMVERFNGRISDILRTHRFKDAEELSDTLLRYVDLYNRHLPQKALNHRTPLATLQSFAQSHPQRIHPRRINLQGHDSYGQSCAFSVRRA